MEDKSILEPELRGYGEITHSGPSLLWLVGEVSFPRARGLEISNDLDVGEEDVLPIGYSRKERNGMPLGSGDWRAICVSCALCASPTRPVSGIN